MKSRILALMFAAAVMAACSSTPPQPEPAPAVTSVAGPWVLSLEMPGSGQPATDAPLTLAQAGKELSGTIDTPMGAQNLTGTYDGQDIKFGFNLNAQGNNIRVDFVGQSDGQTMSGKATFGTYGEGTFKGKRK